MVQYCCAPGTLHSKHETATDVYVCVDNHLVHNNLAMRHGSGKGGYAPGGGEVSWRWGVRLCTKLAAMSDVSGLQ